MRQTRLRPHSEPQPTAEMPLRRIWLFGFAAALGLYALTVAPDVLMMDSGECQWLVAIWPRIELPQGPANLVRVHVNYLLTANAFGLVAPVGNWALRANLFSALMGAMAVGNACAAAGLLTRSRMATLLTGLSLALSQTFWQYSTIAEVLTFVAATASLEILLLLQWTATGRSSWLLALWAVNGFACGAHMQAGLATPAYAIAAGVAWRRGAVRSTDLVACAAVWIAGFAPYLVFCMQWLAAAEADSAWTSATVGTYGGQMLRMDPRIWLRGLLGIALNYPTGLALLFIPGIVQLLRSSAPGTPKWTWLVVAGAHLAFALTYAVPDQHSFLVPLYALAAPLIGLGAVPLLRNRLAATGLLVLAVLVVPIYAVLPGVARRLPLGPRHAEVPYRDPYEFYLRPWKTGWRAERRYIEEALDALPQGAAFYSSSTIRTAMRYIQDVEARRQDIRINPPVVELAEGLRGDNDAPPSWPVPVYAWAPEGPGVPELLSAHCRFEQQGIVWRVLPPADPAAFVQSLSTGPLGRSTRQGKEPVPTASQPTRTSR